MGRLIALRVLASVAPVLWAMPALADASLTLTPVDSTCYLTTGTGTMPVFRSFPCSPSPDSPVILSNLYGLSPSSPINQSSIVLSYEFSYSDDGLRLATPQTLQVGTPTANAQLPRWDPNYLRVRTPQTVSFEAATVSLLLEGSGATPFYSVSMVVSGTDPGAFSFQNGVLMFGLNDHPDDISGTLAISITAPAFPATLTAVTAGASVGSVNAVPEPSTYLLVAIGLAAIAVAARRRSDVGHRGAA